MLAFTRSWCDAFKPEVVKTRLTDPKEKQQPRPKRFNVCAVFVTFFPDECFRERVARIAAQVSKIIIVDNTGTSTPARTFTDNDWETIEVIGNEENNGIGEALNQGVSRAIELGYDWVLTLDQDSWANPELVETLENMVLVQTGPQRVGIVGCNYVDENTQAPAARAPAHEPGFWLKETVITSGSLLSAAAYLDAGPFRSDFFIDFIDHEYCLRLRKLGYKVLMTREPLMTHALGGPTKYRLGGSPDLSLVLTNRSPLRRYYMTRNALLVARKYFTVEPRWVAKSLASVLCYAPLKIVLEKETRAKKLLGTFCGALDGLRSRTGRARLPWLLR